MTPDQASSTPEGEAGALTRFLRDGAGRSWSDSELVPQLYAELRAIADGYLRKPDRRRTLQPTALVHEVFIKLFGGARLDVNDRRHFFRLAARAMRQLLVDHARRGRGSKRDAAREVTLDEAVASAACIEVDWLDLHAALEELAGLDERQAHVVELRFFGGLEMDEVAEALEVSKSTVEREWRAARAWLGVRLVGRGAP